ncbi:hypothetical protein ACJMK2_007264 [Sinanodonta woodiana]|uniref:tRNA pseudouridine synthase n=1 Tax=Sinanodonta woodiana TaxID=1069815 RepID=A0ABD3VI14_SINWO
MRYVLFFSYIGTRYSGLQIQNGAQMKKFQTIQGVLQLFLHRLFFPNKVVMKTCSRTDTGVHALMNTASFDPQLFEHNNRIYEPNQIKTAVITKSLNSHLAKANHQIRILKTCRVTDDFMVRRKVTSRSYVYRICLKHGNRLVAGPSPFELERVLVIMQPFDFNKFLEAAELLSGTHDFANFMMQKGLEEAKNTVLTMSINIKRGSSVIDEYQNLSMNQLDFWEIHFKSRGFLWRQIRRMVSLMIGVGKGKYDLNVVKDMLTKKNYTIFSPFLTSAPASALYLKQVEYEPDVSFETDEDDLLEKDDEDDLLNKNDVEDRALDNDEKMMKIET